jgi:hypothetical protein
VSFNSSIEKTFFISAFLHDNTYELDISDNKINSRINSNNIGASIKVEKTTLNCTSPQVPNETKTACIVPVVNTDTTYTMLAPLPGLEGTINTVDDCPFGKYLNIIIKLIMGISAVLAMVMITMGGIQYITSDLVSNKEAGRETITHAILGLVMMLGAFLILNTVNPKLLNACLKMPTVTINISPDDTSTGSSTSLCISTTNPPNVTNVQGTTLTINSNIQNEYLPELNKISAPTGVKLLITAQTVFEGFSTGTKSYRTKNPGNIGNTDSGAIVTYNTLAEGIKKQVTVVTNVANNSSQSYKIGNKPTCALGNETYNGSLYQYLRIYATGARIDNNYLNAIIGYFKANGKTITPQTTIAQIYAMN